jgi:glycosyltransferase involved in cell wall biosynthesis
MPVYNGERFIKAAIESILNQSFTDFELVIVNDGSTDNTVAIVESFSDSRIKLLHNEMKTGLAHVRNRAIAASKGKYIALLDSDDIAYPGRFQKQVDFLEANLNYCLVAGGVDLINAEGQITGRQVFNYADKEIRVRLFFHNCISQSSVMLRKCMLPCDEPYDPDYPPAEDYHLWVRMAANHPIHLMKHVLIQYRAHDNNTSVLQREITDRAVSNVLKYQLIQIGINNPNNEDINIQLSLVYNVYSAERSFLERANNYFSSVLTANRKVGYFSRSVFNQIDLPIYVATVTIIFC